MRNMTSWRETLVATSARQPEGLANNSGDACRNSIKPDEMQGAPSTTTGPRYLIRCDVIWPQSDAAGTLMLDPIERSNHVRNAAESCQSSSSRRQDGSFEDPCDLWVVDGARR